MSMMASRVVVKRGASAGTSTATVFLESATIRARSTTVGQQKRSFQRTEEVVTPGGSAVPDEEFLKAELVGEGECV
jgi:hypothetical protein